MASLESIDVLTCDGLHKSWGGVRALDDVALAVSVNEVLGLTGANGAGKSTLLNAIGGQIRLDQGRVQFAGRVVERWAPMRRRRLGMARTFQATRVFTGLKVLDNVALAAAYGSRRWPPVRFSRSVVDAAREALRVVNLEKVEQVVAGELGVYEEKRLMLAMALAPKPKVLLLDEPAAGLTPAEVDETVSVVQRIREWGTTVIVVDHVIGFIQEVADRVVVLHEGRVLTEGAPESVFRDPQVRATWLGEAIA